MKSHFKWKGKAYEKTSKIPPLFKSLPYSRKVTFPTTFLLMFFLETILKNIKKDINWAWTSSFEKTNKKNFKCFGLCPFLLLMRSLFVCWDDPSSIASLVIFKYFLFISKAHGGKSQSEWRKEHGGKSQSEWRKVHVGKSQSEWRKAHVGKWQNKFKWNSYTTLTISLWSCIHHWRFHLKVVGTIFTHLIWWHN